MCIMISVRVSVVHLSLLQLNAGSYLRLLCLAEDMRTDLSDVSSLLRLNGCDIRQSLLQLQYWTRSAGGRHITRPLAHTGKNGKEMSCKNVWKGLNNNFICNLILPYNLMPIFKTILCHLQINIFPSFALKDELKPETSNLPPCDTGCTESMLGLLNIEPERDIWQLLRVNCSFTTYTG